MHGLIDFILHLDRHIHDLVHQFGPQVYLVFFLIIFCETGLVIFPFLPGDSLLFTIGVLAHPGKSGLNIWIIVPLLSAAAFIGDNLNYQIGMRLGQRLLEKGDTRFLKRSHIEKTQEFFEKNGGMTLVLARWVPIVRTFAPFVAGMGAMEFRSFLGWSGLGAVIWVGGCTFAGFFFGKIKWVEENFALAMLAMVLLSVLPMLIKFRMSKQKK